MRSALVGIVLFFSVLLIYVFGFVFYENEFLEAKNSKAVVISEQAQCEFESSPEAQGVSLKGRKGFSYWLKTPKNYLGEQKWPLLLVFSPSVSGKIMERYTGLTGVVTEAGFIVAYVDTIPMRVEVIKQLPDVLRDISSRWCVDEKRVYLAGHSDGATISQALNLFSETEQLFAGFISSAAGMQKSDLDAYSCPSAKNVFLLQNKGDTHFENFSEGAFEWWSNCMECEGEPKIEKGCTKLDSCRGGKKLVFCEQDGGHMKWPRRQTEMAEFLKEFSHK
jgi:poly(3-hydroxybutyrate) depolymerase